MITIESPSMSVNDSRSNRHYTLDHTFDIQSTHTMQQIADEVVNQAGQVADGVIQNLVLNGHGSPGSFQIGTGLNINSMSPFGDVKGKVFKIWFRGCLVARVIDSDTPNHGDGAALQAYGFSSGNGHEFISAFARLTGCYVVAPTELQGASRRNYTSGTMDGYEGLVLSYDPKGNISWQRRYPSLSNHNPQARTASLPNRE